MSYSVLDNIAVELIAAAVLALMKIVYMFFSRKDKHKNTSSLTVNSDYSNMTWTPKIVKIIVKCYDNSLNSQQTFEQIKLELNDDELSTLYNKFTKKAKKKNCTEGQLISKRVGDLLKEAEEISRYGQDNLNDWIYNRNNARSFGWRAEKKKEYGQKNKIK